jgi:hypothetical protein
MEYPSKRPAPLYGDAVDDELERAFDDADRRPRYLPILIVTFIIATFVAIIVLIALRPAAAQPVIDMNVYDQEMRRYLSCRPDAIAVPRQVLAINLAVEFREAHVSTVFLTPVAIAELYINPDTGSFTILCVNPRKMACVVLDGTSYRALDHWILELSS